MAANVGWIGTGVPLAERIFIQYRREIEGTKGFDQMRALNAAYKKYAWVKNPNTIVGRREEFKNYLLREYRSAFRTGTLSLLKETKAQLAAGGLSAGIASGLSFLGVDVGVIVASGSAYVMGAAVASTVGAAAIGGGVGTIINHVTYDSTTLSDTQRDLVRFEQQADSQVTKFGFRVLRGIFW